MRILLIIIFLCVSLFTNAQNIQVFTNTRENLITTEYYKAFNNHGTVYYFTDFKINKHGYSEAYTELSVYYNIKDIFSPTLQYNAGINHDFYIEPVYLIGLSKQFVINEKHNLSFDLMYRYQKELLLENEYLHGYQLTTIFLFNYKKIEFSGIIDFWNIQYYIFEPQLWYKINNVIYTGCEFRLSNYNILNDYQNYILLGFKFNLN